MVLSTSRLTPSASCTPSGSRLLLKRDPRRSDGHLPAVVKAVKSVLKSGMKVYLCSRSETYAHRIRQIRIASFGEFLRVKTAYGWSTVWYSESLVDESGGVLFSPAEYDEIDEVLLDDLLDSFLSDFAVLPWHKSKAA